MTDSDSDALASFLNARGFRHRDATGQFLLQEYTTYPCNGSVYNDGTTMPAALAQHHAILREQMGVSMSPVEREAYERILDGARVALDDQEFAEAWAERRATPQEQVVEYALRET